MNDIPPEETTHCQKKMKADESSARRQCRGADVIIRSVLPFLIDTVDYEEESNSYAESAESDS
jgi:hypothetical protein